MASEIYLVALLFEYLKGFDKKTNKNELQLVLQSGPAYPSLLSIKQTCEYFGLKTNGYQGDFDSLVKIEMPVIAHWKKDNAEKFVLIKEVTQENVTCFDALKQQKIEISREDFCKFWSGVLIKSIKTVNQGVAKRRFKVSHLWFFGLAVLAILIAIFFQYQNTLDKTALYYAIVLFFLKATGVWLTANIMKHEAGIPYPPFERFCYKKEYFDCNKVLSSNAARIFNTISLADIGTVYFLTGIFVMLLYLLNGIPNAILLLFYGAVSGLPFVLFSGIYQKYILKKWCPLCLGVIGLILIENLVFLLYPGEVFPNTSFLLAGIALTVSLTFSILIVLYFKNLLKAQAESFASKLQSLRIKRNPEVLYSLFNRQKTTEVPKKHNIVIGNSKAHIVITTLLSPMCNPCKKLTGEIMELIIKQPEYFCWQIRFDGVEKEEGNLNKIQLHLMQLCNRAKDENLKLKIISDWYSKQSFRWFSAKYPVREITSEITSNFAEIIIENQKLGLKKLPVLWVNDKELPEEYSIADIPYLTTDVNLFLQVTKHN